MPTIELRDLAISALEDQKGIDIQCLDVRGQADFADYMIIVTGSSSRHVKSLAQSVLDAMSEAGEKPLGIEGADQGEWILIDLSDVVVHVMLAKTRDFYDIERLWSMGPTRGEKGSEADH
ncbi:MAG: ribosome silencing factor [Proteobacteria bacterium]|jgi:ribosome-associated protein|nr:ribosome silencing factor [Pseudomonadota bacterium]MDA1298492.1 ribosome silencing factor [Pseudomonadota bacterium]